MLTTTNGVGGLPFLMYFSTYNKTTFQNSIYDPFISSDRVAIAGGKALRNKNVELSQPAPSQPLATAHQQTVKPCPELGHRSDRPLGRGTPRGASAAGGAEPG